MARRSSMPPAHRRILVRPFEQRAAAACADRQRAVLVGKALPQIDGAELGRERATSP